MIFVEAREFCISEGGDLAIIPDAATNEEVIKIKADGDSSWFGLRTPDLRFREDPADFGFVDGTKLLNGFGLGREKIPWLIGQPILVNSTGFSCAFITNSNNKWAS